MGVLLRRVFAIFFLLFLASDAHAQGQNLFFQAPTYPGSGQTVTADFNQDGKPDLVRADGTVLLGKGDGTFTVGTPVTAGGQSSSNLIAWGDLNGDGKPDLVLVSSSVLYVLLGNGDGTFQPAITMNMGASLASLVVADFNGDGKLDVAGISPGTGLLVFLGKGNGTFAPGVVYPVPANTFPILAVGDFNGGDNKPDIAFALGLSTSAPVAVGVQLGNGDGTFQTAITSSTGVSFPVVAIAANDFNGDGKLDLAISDGGSETFILLGNGNGTFQAPSSPLPGGFLGAGDLNGDGKLDVVVGADPHLVEVFLGNGDGTFALKDTYFNNRIPPGTDRLALVADFNGDGKPDVAMDGQILLGNGDGSLQDNPAFSLNSAGIGGAVTGDFNRDGNLDIVVPSPGSINNGLFNNLLVLLSDGTGKFVLAHSYVLASPVASLATADLNHDGKLDLLFTTPDSNLIVMLGNGDGTFASPTVAIQGIPGPVTKTGIADFNGDHMPDLAVVSQQGLAVFLGKGDGTFASPVSYFAGSGPNSVVTADFNNDGIIDIAVGSSAALGILLGKGDGTFQPATFSNPEGAVLAATADLNGDGKVDLIEDGGSVAVLLGNGDGTFQAALTSPTGSQVVGPFLTAVDLNGDGKLDLVVSPGLEALLGNGDGTFGIPVVAVQGSKIFGPGASFVLVADFNGDHRPDVVLDVNQFPGIVATILNVAGPAMPDFLIAASPLSPPTVKPGSSSSTTVTLTPGGGFSEAVALSCVGLPSGANCTFSPSSLPNGSGTSTLTLSTSASSPQATYFVSIVGTSATLTHERLLTLTVAASPGATTVGLAPAALTFAQQATGTASSAQSITFTNTGAVQVNISDISITGANAGDFAQTNSCGSSLAAGVSCQISVTFTPTGMGGRSAAISISSNATGSPQMVTLTGAGPDFSVTPGSTTTATVTPGQTATYTISVAPGGGFNQNVTLTCSGAPTGATCSVAPATISLNGTSAATATVTVTTTAASQLLLPVDTDAPRGMNDRLAPLLLCLLAMLMIASLHISRRDQWFRWAPALTLGLLLCVGIALTSCGGGSSGGSGGGGSGTQAGSYTLTVSASVTSGSTTLTHSTNLTLVVQ